VIAKLEIIYYSNF